MKPSATEKSIRVIALTVLSIVLYGCSQSAEPVKTESISAPNTNISMAGTYRANCYHTRAGTYATTELNFTDTDFASQTRHFTEDDSACSGTSVGEEMYNGTYTAFSNQINYRFSNGRVLFNVFSSDEVSLSFGDTSLTAMDGSTPETRPINVSGVTYSRI